MNGPIFTLRPWQAADGNAGNPTEVHGVVVVRRVCRRHDAPGALVALADGRYALTGPLIAIGAPRQMQRFLSRRAALARDLRERSWQQTASRALKADLRRRGRPLL